MSINLTDELLAKTKKGKIASAKQVFLDGDQENLQQIGEKTHQLEDAIKDITISGGASTATAVSYNNETSGMTAITAQGAIDELADKNQEQDAAIGTKAEKSEVTTELDKKFDKENIAHEFGESKDKAVSQFALPFREIESPEFIKVIVDAEGHFLFGIQLDGSIEWGKGIPSPIRAKLQEIINQCKHDKADILETINAAKEELSTSIIALQEGKVDKEKGKSLIENEVKECFRVIENEEFIMAVVDAEYRLLFGIYRATGKPYFPFNEMYHIEQNEEFIVLFLDSENHVVFGIRRDGEIIGEIHAVNTLKRIVSKNSEAVTLLKNQIVTICKDITQLKEDTTALKENLNIDVVGRNSDKLQYLYNACRWHKESDTSKDFQMLIVTDTHHENLSVENAIKVTNGYETIDAVIHCGDIVGSGFAEKSYVTDKFMPTMEKSIKPWFVVVGNHDVGNTRAVIAGATHEDTYYTYIKPMIDNKILKDGEYINGKCYYYHDFPLNKIRLIVLYEYDNPIGVEDLGDSEYWTPISYDSSLSAMTNGAMYSVGDKVNCANYKSASFICKKEVTVSNAQYPETFTTPFYKTDRASRIIRKEQADWFIQTLSNVPNGYGVIVACHNPAVMNSKNQTQYKFATNKEIEATAEGQYHMENDIVADIVNAWVNKTSLNENISCNSVGWGNGNSEYLNTKVDSNGKKYYYSITADFSERASDAFFSCYLCGHTHEDLIFKDKNSGALAITPICGNTSYGSASYCDVSRPYNIDSYAYDALTAISVKKDRIALVRIGNDTTVDFEKRDYEII